jgi:hypothetical protein
MAWTGLFSGQHRFALADPDNTYTSAYRLRFFEKAGRTPEAAALLGKALAAGQSCDDLAVALSQLYVGMGSFGKAEALPVSRLQADPKSVALGSALAPIYLMTDHTDDAKRVYGVLSVKRVMQPRSTDWRTSRSPRSAPTFSEVHSAAGRPRSRRS